MGNNTSISTKKHAMNTNYSCYDDTECKNIDSNRSTADNIVYSCPDATCATGSCQCGKGCILDPYTGTCCQGIVDIRGDSFCIEYTEPPVPATVSPIVPSVFPTSGPVTTSSAPMPTYVPTIMPTRGPTMMPTMMPTMQPTMMPTMMPTMQPTMQPTMMPSSGYRTKYVPH